MNNNKKLKDIKALFRRYNAAMLNEKDEIKRVNYACGAVAIEETVAILLEISFDEAAALMRT